MSRPGPSVTSGADLQPGSDSLFPSGFTGGGAKPSAGSVGTGEIADGSVAAADGNVAVFDLYQRLGSHSTAETNGLILASDHQHPSDAGQLFYADAFADWLGRV